MSNEEKQEAKVVNEDLANEVNDEASDEASERKIEQINVQIDKAIDNNMRNAEEDNRRKFFGLLTINYIAAIIGAVGLLFLIITLGVDELWTAKVGSLGAMVKVTFKWKKADGPAGYDADYDDLAVGDDLDDVSSRGQGWMAMGLLSLFTLIAAIAGSALEKFIPIPKKILIVTILYAVSAFLLFIGFLVVVAYGGPNTVGGFGISDWKPAASPILSFFTLVIIAIPAGLLVYFELLIN